MPRLPNYELEDKIRSEGKHSKPFYFSPFKNVWSENIFYHGKTYYIVVFRSTIRTWDDVIFTTKQEALKFARRVTKKADSLTQ